MCDTYYQAFNGQSVCKFYGFVLNCKCFVHWCNDKDTEVFDATAKVLIKCSQGDLTAKVFGSWMFFNIWKLCYRLFISIQHDMNWTCSQPIEWAIAKTFQRLIYIIVHKTAFLLQMLAHVLLSKPTGCAFVTIGLTNVTYAKGMVRI